jgi:hypothetical protein
MLISLVRFLIAEYQLAMLCLNLSVFLITYSKKNISEPNQLFMIALQHNMFFVQQFFFFLPSERSRDVSGSPSFMLLCVLCSF